MKIPINENYLSQFNGNSLGRLYYNLSAINLENEDNVIPFNVFSKILNDKRTFSNSAKKLILNYQSDIFNYLRKNKKNFYDLDNIFEPDKRKQMIISSNIKKGTEKSLLEIMIYIQRK